MGGRHRDIQFIHALGSTIQVTVFKSGEISTKNLGLSKQASPDPIRIPSPDAVRNEWLYDQYVNHRKKTNEVIRREARTKGWIIDSDSQFLQCIDRHCIDNNIGKTRRKPQTT
jgi:hypothetical protein